MSETFDTWSLPELRTACIARGKVIRELEITQQALREQVEETSRKRNEGYRQSYDTRMLLSHQLRIERHRVRRWKFYAGLAIVFSIWLAVVSGLSHAS